MPVNPSIQEIEARGSGVHSELTGYIVSLRPMILPQGNNKSTHTKIPARLGEQKVTLEMKTIKNMKWIIKKATNFYSLECIKK